MRRSKIVPNLDQLGEVILQGRCVSVDSEGDGTSPIIFEGKMMIKESRGRSDYDGSHLAIISGLLDGLYYIRASEDRGFALSRSVGAEWHSARLYAEQCVSGHRARRELSLYSKMFRWEPEGRYRHYIQLYRVAPKNPGTVGFLGLCSDHQLSFFTLLDRASFPHYNNTKIIKFGWELFILWVISYVLSFSGFAIDLSLIVPRNSGNRANPENDSP